MVNLILKDAIIQKKTFLASIGYGVFIFLVFGMGGGNLAPAAYIMGTVGMTYIFLQNGCANDDKNNTEVILNSLPITRREIVLAKYGSSVGMSIFNWIMMSIIGMIFLQFFPGRVNRIRYWDVVIGLVSAWLLISVFLPFYFKLGFVKARYFYMLVFFLFFFGPSAAMGYMREGKDIPFINTLVIAGQGEGAWLIGRILLLIGISAVLVSIGISTKVYKSRAL